MDFGLNSSPPVYELNLMVSPLNTEKWVKGLDSVEFLTLRERTSHRTRELFLERYNGVQI